MRRHLPRLLLTGALLSPVTLYALGLGEIRLNSALNQPFNAEIELLSPTTEELGSLKVALAGNDVFSRYGIDRPQYLSNFEFAVSRTRDGKATIRVTSNRSVTEPYVTLLVEATWARGRLVREYTVLLDPPVFMPSQNEAPAPVTTPQSATTAEGRIERAPTPAPEPAPAPTPRATAPTPAPERAPEPVAQSTEPSDSQIIASPGSEYTVQRNDTLSRIAAAANPGNRRVNNRTMIALFRANPQAFSGNNINRLRAGSVLRIPELSEIEAIPNDEAASEVARQAAEWSGGVVADTTPEADRLRLVTPQETPAQPVPAPTPQTQAQQQPSRPSTAPGAQTPPDRRLEVENPGLAQAQRNVEPTPAEQPVEPTTPPTEAQAPTPAEQPAATAEPTPAPEATPPRKPRANPAQTAPAAPEPSLVDRLTEYWWAVVGLGLALVVGVLFMRRRRESDDDSLDSLSSPLNFEPPSERPARALAPSNKGGRADAFLVEGEDDAGLVKTNLDEDLDFDPPPTSRREPARSFEPAAAAAPARAVEDTMSSESAVRFDQQDALAEADFHMAYGLYDQAADLVKIAIDREPTRRDLKLKLLEIYFVWGNKDLFLDTARDLYETRDDAAAGEWDKVLIMGKQIAPENDMFKGEGSGHVDLVDVNLEGGENRVDVDLFAEPNGEERQGLDLEFASGERRGPNDATQVASELDFLLDEPNDDDTQEQRTREIDALARTQETPTIESPMIDRTSSTVREKVDQAIFNKGTNTGDTAELSIDDLGLDADSLDSGRALEDTHSLDKDTIEDVRPLRDDEMTQLAPSLSSFDRTMEAPRVAERFDGDIESTGTIYIDQVDLTGGGDTAEHPRPDVDSTASMKKPLAMTDIDLDLEDLSDVRPSTDTVRQTRKDEDIFSSDVFGSEDRTQEVRGGVDLDVGEPLSSHEDREPTQRHVMATEMELSELEPVTMSEVGTKLDLARAYMDMGDPDGARSILDEVLSEGNPSQKQEAQRLMDSIR